jgi:hypothetical protein
MPGLALLNAAFILTVAQALKNRFNAELASSPGAGHSTFRIPHSAFTTWLPICLVAFIVGDLLVNNAGMWFARAPVQLSRELYPGNPFPESVQIADYLKEHTSPTDTVAVIGSEPQILFLSHRHSASGYIYVYPLTEPQPLAPQMGKEFISQIETARPKYVVFVNTPMSWYSLITPDSFRYAATIQNWWANYSTNYDLVGALKMSPDKPSQYFWNEELPGPSDATNSNVLVYRRKFKVQDP